MFQETVIKTIGGGGTLAPEPQFAGIEAGLGDTAAVSAQGSSVPWVRACGGSPPPTRPGGSQQGLCFKAVVDMNMSFGNTQFL